MSTEPEEATTKPDVPAAAPARSPDLPALSKDAWELVQYRLWDHLRSKMWTTLTIFLTLVTVGGLLGIPAFISSRVDQKIADERAKFDQLRFALESERLAVITRSDIATYATLAWSQDVARFQLLLLKTSSALDSTQGIEATRNVVRLIISKLARFELGADAFRSEVRMLTDVLKTARVPESNNYSDNPLTEDEWAAFRGASTNRGLGSLLPDLYELYSHVFALKVAVLKNYEIVIDPALADPARRAKLYEQYGIGLYPAYQQSLAAVYGGSRPAWLRGGSDWTWLPESAVSAFGEQEKRINRTNDAALKK
jgi:hypothetical protein